ncbi:MAG: hypothetical protein AAGJ82_14135 [Bacteroidota bacterium]
MQGLSFSYPTWFLAFCVLAGLAYAAVLYFRDDSFKEAPSWLTSLLSVLRFLAIGALVFLLLGPILRSTETRSQKPVVILAQDGSESVAASWVGTDSATYVQSVQQLATKLGEEYDLQTFTFGEDLRDTLDFSFGDKRTNLASLLRQIYDLYSNQNLGAVIIGSDGIYNEGATPVYTDVKLNAPVYTIGLGDTTVQKDLIIKRVFHNKIAYLGDQFSIQVDIAAQNAAGSTVPLRIARIENGRRRELVNESVTVNRNDFFLTREFILDAEVSGPNRYRISLGTVADEVTTVNNSRDIYVDILEARQKVLLLAHAPHPDLSALKQAISEGRNNEVEVAYASSFTANVRDYDLVILHQLPSNKFAVNQVIEDLAAANIPTLYMAGQALDFGRFNGVQDLLRINSNGRNTNEVEPHLASSFSLFNVDEEVRSVMTALPPVTAPFGTFMPGGNASTLLYQRIGRVNSDYPLLVLGESAGRRQAVFAATGIWKWRMFDYLDKKNHDRYNELVSQIIQYLSVKDDKRRFRVSLAKNIFDENEPIIFDAELYNDNYELINDPSASLVITDEDGREFSYTFNPTGQGYRLNAGILPVGNYRFSASVNTGTENLSYGGRFSVQPIQLERFATTADHNLLRLLSQRYGGELLSPASVASLPQLLAERGTVKPVLYDTVNTRSLINLKGIFFLMLLLLSLEWLLRRYFGGY